MILQHPYQGQGGDWGAIGEVMNPANGHEGDGHSLGAGGCDNLFFHD